jgi:hypothetical protein
MSPAKKEAKTAGKTNDKKAIRLLPWPHLQSGPDSPALLRILHSREMVQLDFGYPVFSGFHKGGWVNFHPEAYLIDTKSQQRYPLIEALNIPMAPERFNFEHNRDRMFFSLRFAPIPFEKAGYDLIETEKPLKNAFYYRGIAFDPSQCLVCDRELQAYP